MNSLMMLSNVFLLLTRSLASARRIAEVLEERSDITDGEEGLTLEHGTVEFDHVSFKYRREAAEYLKVLEKLSPEDMRYTAYLD